MKNLISFYIGLISICCFSQTTDFMNFEIDFELDISKTNCYSHTGEVKNDSVKLDFYLITNRVTSLQSEIINQSNDFKYTLKGVYEYIVGAPIFYPTLVIMAEPIFDNNSECNKKIKTYFVDLQNVKSNQRISDFEQLKYGGYIIKLDLQKIKLSSDNFIKIHQKNEKLTLEYLDYFPSNFMDTFRYGIENWYKL